jgi:very-short-patch-repair endonuclease
MDPLQNKLKNTSISGKLKHLKIKDIRLSQCASSISGKLKHLKIKDIRLEKYPPSIRYNYKDFDYTYISKDDVMSVLGYKGHIRDTRVKQEVKTIKPNGETGKDKISNNDAVEMFPIHYIDTVVTDLLKRRRITSSKKKELCQFFGIVPEKGAIEMDTMELLEYVSPFPVERNYSVGRYKVDGYIKELKLAIEVDENGHKNYDSHDEKTRTIDLYRHGIVVERINPDIHKNPSWEVVKMVMNRMCSPDYRFYMQMPPIQQPMTYRPMQPAFTFIDDDGQRI